MYFMPREKYHILKHREKNPCQLISINQGLFCIKTNNNNNIHTFAYMNTERAGNEVILLM